MAAGTDMYHGNLPPVGVKARRRLVSPDSQPKRYIDVVGLTPAELNVHGPGFDPRSGLSFLFLRAEAGDSLPVPLAIGSMRSHVLIYGPFGLQQMGGCGPPLQYNGSSISLMGAKAPCPSLLFVSLWSERYLLHYRSELAQVFRACGIPLSSC